MLALISPAKKLDFDREIMTAEHSAPAFLNEAGVLIESARKLKASDLKSLMGISDKLAELNVERFKAFSPPFTPANARQAIYAFRGDVYQGLDADSLDTDDLAFAQEHVRILSGLYGLLRPLDLIQPYRLEMGIKFRNAEADDLYGYWRPKLAPAINKALGGDTLINLASKEYFSAVDLSEIESPVITPIFKDERDGALKVISFNAKKARGEMVRYIIDNRINDPEKLKGFEGGGYRYQESLSDAAEWVFVKRSDQI